MSFSDHKITQFTHRISELADQPNLPADELKARFDSCPEELRVAHNAICDDAARLEARVEGIVVDTFGDTIDKEMLSDELAAELDGMEDGIDALEESVAQKCECYFGTYTGTGTSTQQVNLGFHPKAVIVIDSDSRSETTQNLNFCGLGIQDNPISAYSCVFISETGFTAKAGLNLRNYRYSYAAFK